MPGTEPRPPMRSYSEHFVHTQHTGPGIAVQTLFGPSYHSKDMPQAGTGLDLPSAHCTTSLLAATPTSTPAPAQVLWAMLEPIWPSESLRPGFMGLRGAVVPKGSVPRKKLMMLVTSRAGLRTPT